MFSTLFRRIVMLAIALPLAVTSGAQLKPVATRTVSHRLSSPAIAPMQVIKPENIETHVRFLSLDLFEGRGTGQRGGDLAAEYIATQFSLYGLKPAGDNGTYMQKVPLVGVTTLADQSSFLLEPSKGDAMKLAFRDEYVAYNETLTPRVEVDADIVFVGYGIEA